MTKNIDVPFFPAEEFLWTLERYHHAIETHTLTEEDRVELLYGKIIELMPAGSSHEECVSLLAEFFKYRFGRKYRYREEKSISLPGLHSEPEPDFVVVMNRKYGKQRPLPEEVFFIAEVSNSSLSKDRTVKVELYAEANLAEYWIINLIDRQIEVHLQPKPEQKLYGSVSIYAEHQSFVSPFAGEVVVAELLPEAEV